jgi:general secretion pathway protein M
MKKWLLSLSQRERTIVLSAAVVVILFLFYLIIVSPVATHYNENKKNVATANETLEWMKAAAQKVKALRGGSSANKKSKDKQFVLGVIDRSIKKAGLAAVMKRVQPEGESGVRVWFENAAFDDLMLWLATIESENGLVVNEINIEETEVTGLVNVRVFLN